MRILVVEDERRLADTIVEALRANHYLADAVYDGNDGYDYAMSGIYDLIILDVMLPHMDGFEITRRLRREKCSIPILMLTVKSEVGDRVNGLNSGADYYLTKPFDMDELLACVNVLLRRQGEPIHEVLRFGNTTLDLSTCKLSCGSAAIRLSSREFEIMRLLMTNQTRNVSKETLLTKVWGFDSNADENHVEVYVSFLRKKLAYIGSDIRIEAVRRQGYHLEVEKP